MFTRPQRIFLAVASGAFILGGLGTALSLTFFNPKQTKPVTQQTPPLPPILTIATTTPDVAIPVHPLTSLPWDGAPTSTRPIAVVIDNAPEARPQWGLHAADIVYNTPVEGGITRLVAIFSSQTASKIGPVRSARPYFIRQAQDWGALFVHSGGSAEATKMLEKRGVDGVADMNEFSLGPYFWRTSSPGPHNLFTSSSLLLQAASRRTYSLELVIKPIWNFGTSTIPINDGSPPQQFSEGKASELLDRDRRKLSGAGEAVSRVSEVTIPYSMKSMAVTYRFNPETLTYDRFHNGAPHRDTATGKPLSPTNVILEFKPLTDIADPNNYGLINFSYEGKGEFLAITQGEIQEGTWSRSKDGPTVYATKTGEPLNLSPGQTFIEVIPATLRDQVLNTINITRSPSQKR